MGWRIMGRIFDPREHRDWAGTHAQVPTVLVKERVLRIYYADRDRDGRSYTTYLDVDRGDLGRVIYHHRQPLLPLGRRGTFDDDGMMPSLGDRAPRARPALLQRLEPRRDRALPQLGRHRGQRRRRRHLRALYEGPVLDRTPLEPYIAVTPTMLKDGDRWRMWYVSGTDWSRGRAASYEPVYVIKYAQSRDGIRWDRPNHLCVAPRHDGEAFSHPTVDQGRRPLSHVVLLPRFSGTIATGAAATASVTRSRTTAAGWSGWTTPGRHHRLGQRLGLDDDLLPVRRARRWTNVDVLQRQQLRPDRLRLGRT